MIALPDHIIRKSETWFYNSKTAKYIHKDKIDDFLERYWEWKDKNNKAYKDKAIADKKRRNIFKK